jgi:hypothetical protein
MLGRRGEAVVTFDRDVRASVRVSERAIRLLIRDAAPSRGRSLICNLRAAAGSGFQIGEWRDGPGLWERRREGVGEERRFSWIAALGRGYQWQSCGSWWCCLPLGRGSNY